MRTKTLRSWSFLKGYDVFVKCLGELFRRIYVYLHKLQEKDTLQEELQEYYKTLHMLQEEEKK